MHTLLIVVLIAIGLTPLIWENIRDRKKTIAARNAEQVDSEQRYWENRGIDTSNTRMENHDDRR